jgi:hypothetical protein
MGRSEFNMDDVERAHRALQRAKVYEKLVIPTSKVPQRGEGE